MSVEWSVRVLRYRLSGILGEQASRPAVWRYSSAEPILSAPHPSLLTGVRDPAEWRADHDTIDFIVDSPEIEARTFVGLAAYVPRGDDPDSGPFVYVTSGRNTGSYALSIAVAIAAADAAGSAIVDDAGLLGDTRLVDHEELAQRLRPPDAAGLPHAEAIVLALHKTGITMQNPGSRNADPSSFDCRIQEVQGFASTASSLDFFIRSSASEWRRLLESRNQSRQLR